MDTVNPKKSKTCHFCGEEFRIKAPMLTWVKERDMVAIRTWTHWECQKKYFRTAPWAFRFHVKVWVAICDQQAGPATFRRVEVA